MTARQLQAWIRLSFCRSVGARTWNHWLAGLARAGLALEEFFELPEHEARPLFIHWPTIAQALRHEAPTPRQAGQIVERMLRDRIHLVPISSSDYPPRLLSALWLDAPTFLYAAGKLSHLRSAAIAVVGTRHPSPPGEESARAYGAELAHEGIHVVSGHARGIDLAAHQGALEAGGSTTLVLPGGIFAFELAASLERFVTRDNTLVLSQFPPELAGGIELPILRNATIAALGDGLAVIESGLIGGTAHAFRAARHMRKPLWAVIYPPPVPSSAEGNHSLLFAGAQRLEPGAAGARHGAHAMAARLRAAHAHRPKTPLWPLPESPGQAELF